MADLGTSLSKIVAGRYLIEYSETDSQNGTVTFDETLTDFTDFAMDVHVAGAGSVAVKSYRTDEAGEPGITHASSPVNAGGSPATLTFSSVSKIVCTLSASDDAISIWLMGTR